eukprot:TRINITY_DN14695_c0_g1_i1.p1 TRINITY_DN14695_c0_g1~~TRINITY_DN14695_c0_g1_i1.p1  ORF type:complete len:465 (+),score=88.54 TRINITY_DN14695_c0_g1_i1:152-1546(+)
MAVVPLASRASRGASTNVAANALGSLCRRPAPAPAPPPLFSPAAAPSSSSTCSADGRGLCFTGGSGSSSSRSTGGAPQTLLGQRRHTSTASVNLNIKLSKSRMEALLASEIVHFARALEPHPITLQEILAHRDPETLRYFLLEELPIRYAKRLALIETVPNWQENPHILQVRSLYTDAFHRLRMVPGSDAARFRIALQNIKRRNSNMLSYVVKGVRLLKSTESVSEEFVSDFLDTFLTARIGTDILSSQYMALTRPTKASSIIDANCDPVEVVRAAAADAVGLCEHHYGCAPPVEVVSVGEVRFPFIPQYLNYIVFELLKNSLRAVAEQYKMADLVEHPIHVLICGDAESIVVRVSDEGGGIPMEDMSKVYSYLWTTAHPQGHYQPEAEDLDDERDVAPMAGYGCGLPLSRNYASYMGGSLDLRSMYNYGTDAYVYFNRMGDSEEVLRPKNGKRSLPERGLANC